MAKEKCLFNRLWWMERVGDVQHGNSNHHSSDSKREADQRISWGRTDTGRSIATLWSRACRTTSSLSRCTRQERITEEKKKKMINGKTEKFRRMGTESFKLTRCRTNDHSGGYIIDIFRFSQCGRWSRLALMRKWQKINLSWEYRNRKMKKTKKKGVTRRVR